MGGDDEDVGPCLGFGTMCCAICCLLPAATLLCASNEKVAICRTWAIEQAKDNSNLLDCQSTSMDKDGKPTKLGNLGFLMCPVNETSFPSWTQKDISGFRNIKDLLGPTGMKAAAMSRTVKVYQCKESCTGHAPDICNRRLNAPDDESDDNTETDSGFTAVSEERRLLSKRLPDDAPQRRLKKDKDKKKTCHQGPCNSWSYTSVLSESKVSGFSGENPNAANAARGGGCSGYRGADVPTIIGTRTVRAKPGVVKAGVWKLNSNQVSRLPIDIGVTLKNRGTIANDPLTPPSGDLTTENTMVTSNKVFTCTPTSTKQGCIVASFTQAKPKKLAALGKISTDGMFDNAGWQAPGYWLCKGDASANNINAMCPSAKSDDLMNKGDTSCGEGDYTKESILTKLADANSFKVLLLRIVSFLFFWCAVSACLQPIRSILGMMTNMMDSATDCIPCVGGCVDTLTDIFMGVVKVILCIISFCCGGAMFLWVVVVVWIVMKPVLGACLMVVACVCCGGAGFLLHSNKRSKGDARDVPLNEGGGGSNMELQQQDE